MRVKTEDRRQAILEVAHDVFQEMGFEQASMGIISRRLGGSKGTLYGYFRSKEELFETAMRFGNESTNDQAGEADEVSKSGVLSTFSSDADGLDRSENSPARLTTEDRRQAIIRVALETFSELGFERASMSVIARRLGRSKGSLYGFFHSKGELFEAAIRASNQAPGDQIMELLDSQTDDLRTTLIRFSRAYIKFILSEAVVSVTRTCIAEGLNSSLGRHMFDEGPGHALEKMGAFFAEMIRRGKMRHASPKMASIHFKSLMEGGFLEEALFGAKTLKQSTIPETVDVFLRAYGA